MTVESTSTSSLWRLFCAIELPAEARALIDNHVAALRASMPAAAVSWVRASNLHLTLKFIGEVEEARAANLTSSAQRAASAAMPSTILLRSTGVFPKSGSPRILWIGVNDPECGLKTLVEKLESECEEEGFPREQRPFSPHLTIGRLRKPNGAREVAIRHKEMGFEEVEVAVNQLLVIRSQLTNSGSNYTVLSRLWLSGQGQADPGGYLQRLG